MEIILGVLATVIVTILFTTLWDKYYITAFECILYIALGLFIIWYVSCKTYSQNSEYNNKCIRNTSIEDSSYSMYSVVDICNFDVYLHFHLKEKEK